MSALAARRAALVEKLVETAVSSLGINMDLADETFGPDYVPDLRARFTALLASRWQT